MKHLIFSLPFLLFLILATGCKKDDEDLVASIYGHWFDEKSGLFRKGRQWQYYTFKKPDYCKWRCEEADGRGGSIDSLRFTIVNKKLTIYYKKRFCFPWPLFH